MPITTPVPEKAPEAREVSPEKIPPMMEPAAKHQHRQDQKAAGETAVTAMTIVAEDHVSKSQNTKQAQHCNVPPFRPFRMYRSFGTRTG